MLNRELLQGNCVRRKECVHTLHVHRGHTRLFLHMHQEHLWKEEI